MDNLEKTLEEEKPINKVEQRINELSDKVKLTAQERDELAKTKSQLESEKAAVEKERDFSNAFIDAISQYPQARDHKDEIKAKVLSGYTMEDATVSVLAKAGKFSPERPSPAGGSATITPSPTPKSPSEMNRDELRQALVDAEKRGDIYLS